MPGPTARTAYQQRRTVAVPTNNSIRRTYDLLRSSLHHLPSGGSCLVESELIANLSSSRASVRAALQLLAQEGVVARRPNVGTTTLGWTVLPCNELLDEGDKKAHHLHTELVELSVIPAPGVFRTWLGLAPGSSVATIEGLVLRDSVPVGISVSYVGLAPNEAASFRTCSPDAIHVLERVLGVRIGGAETTMAVVCADPQTAAILDIAEGAPMLWLEEVLHDVHGDPCAINQLRYRGDRVALSAIARRPHTAP